MLHLKNLNRSVGENHIIRDINVEIKAGNTIGLVGPNGCGKTSLLNLINGFQIPQEGRILFNSNDITKLSVEKRASLGICRVFQSF
jgi:branched-chain amino acid transport system ATP-binding protein